MGYKRDITSKDEIPCDKALSGDCHASLAVTAGELVNYLKDERMSSGPNDSTD